MDMDIKYSKNIPPIFFKCKKEFGVTWDMGIVITYGDTIYSKFGDNITEDLKVHESTHVRQQLGIGKDIWWDKYFNDRDFRYVQEIEAYKNQLNYINENCNKKYQIYMKKFITDSIIKLYRTGRSLEQIEYDLGN